MKASEEENKAEKRRKATVIVGDMQPIAKILEELEQEVNKASSDKKSASMVVIAPKKKRRTLKKREQEMYGYTYILSLYIFSVTIVKLYTLLM
jgi:hypothetical protein